MYKVYYKDSAGKRFKRIYTDMNYSGAVNYVEMQSRRGVYYIRKDNKVVRVREV